MRLLLLLVMLICVAGSAGADPVAITLTDLSGDYDAGFVEPNLAPGVRSHTFIIPPEVRSIDRLRVVGWGDVVEGAMICERNVGGQTVRDTLPTYPAMRITLTAEPLGGGCYFAVVDLGGAGAAVDVTDCDPGDPLDPDLLLGATIQAELTCGSAPSCTPWIDALATVTRVDLIVEGQVVPTATTTWGEIRALYR